VLGGCGGSATPPATPTATATASPTPTVAAVAIDPQDQPACDVLYARLQRATQAISSGSELIARAENKAQLRRQIATQQVQLQRAATLLDEAVVPAPLASANRTLVRGLRTFAGDFARARAPAARGDFQAAADAMTDRATLQKILAAAQKIEAACKPRGN
jgi:hypothetical protein